MSTRNSPEPPFKLSPEILMRTALAGTVPDCYECVEWSAHRCTRPAYPERYTVFRTYQPVVTRDGTPTSQSYCEKFDLAP